MMKVLNFENTRSRPCALLVLIAALAAQQSACFAVTAKIRVGPVVDLEGTAVVQGDIAFGFGYATSTESGVTGSLGVGSGTGNSLELTDTIEYHRLEEDHGWRAGVRVDAGLLGDKATGSWILGALFVPVRERHSSTSGHEKGGFLDSGSSTSRFSLGLEGRLGVLTREREQGSIEGRPALGASATLEWHGFSRVY